MPLVGATLFMLAGCCGPARNGFLLTSGARRARFNITKPLCVLTCVSGSRTNIGPRNKSARPQCPLCSFLDSVITWGKVVRTAQLCTL